MHLSHCHRRQGLRRCGGYGAPAPAPTPITDEQAQELAGIEARLTDRSVQETCTVRQSDRANTWKDSGAAAFLTGYLKTQGQKNWLQRMDGNTTGSGNQEGVRDCRTQGHECKNPTLTLSLDNMHEALQDSTIQSSLQIGQMVWDFAYESLNFESGPDVGMILAIISSAFGIIGGLASPIRGVAGLFGTFGLTGARAAKVATF
ncbi:hypothetical protein QC764_0053120 [Podospora pseudoanserina]|uniref:Uncharacterized protein n=1 Tax=Podospora pseudoanserina TaxID=2609844 RepID=A0ABR0IDG8_9PEZI|nr:hypothetical protein QC764_0053120 [Podospora pseudoanserina]